MPIFCLVIILNDFEAVTDALRVGVFVITF